MAEQWLRGSFGEWAPDAPLLHANALERAENCYYADGGYQPFPQFQRFFRLQHCSRVHFARSFTFSDGVSRAFLFTDCGLLQLQKGTEIALHGGRVSEIPGWTATDIPGWTKTDVPGWFVGTTDVSDDVEWGSLTSHWITRFGDNIVYGAAGMTPRRHNPVTETGVAELGDAPAGATFGNTIGDYLFLAKGNSVYWSNAHLIDEWNEGVALSQTLPSGGQVVSIAGNRNAFVLCTDGIHIYYPISGAASFRRIEISKEIGIVGHQSPVIVDHAVHAISQDGVIRITEQGAIDTIGDHRVDEWLLSHMDRTRPELIVGIHDRVRHVILWQYSSMANSVPDSADSILCYAYRDQRFTLLRPNRPLQIVLHAETAPVTTDDPQFAGKLTSDPEFAGVTTDDARFSGGMHQLLAVDSTGYMGGFAVGRTSLPVLLQTKLACISAAMVPEGAYVPFSHWPQSMQAQRLAVLQPHAAVYMSKYQVVVQLDVGDENNSLQANMRAFDGAPWRLAPVDNYQEPATRETSLFDCGHTGEMTTGQYHQLTLRISGPGWSNLEGAVICIELDRSAGTSGSVAHTVTV